MNNLVGIKLIVDDLLESRRRVPYRILAHLCISMNVRSYTTMMGANRGMWSQHLRFHGERKKPLGLFEASEARWIKDGTGTYPTKYTVHLLLGYAMID